MEISTHEPINYIMYNPIYIVLGLGPKILKLFSYLTQLRKKLIISMINTTSGDLKEETSSFVSI